MFKTLYDSNFDFENYAFIQRPCSSKSPFILNKF